MPNSNIWRAAELLIRRKLMTLQTAVFNLPRRPRLHHVPKAIPGAEPDQKNQEGSDPLDTLTAGTLAIGDLSINLHHSRNVSETFGGAQRM